jgi:hypothetical protein
MIVDCGFLIEEEEDLKRGDAENAEEDLAFLNS